MTEMQWWEETDPHLMLRQLLRVGAGYRKMRLFSVACCRRIEHLFSDLIGLHTVTLAEQFADEAILAGSLPLIWMPYWSPAEKRDSATMEKGRELLRTACAMLHCPVPALIS